MSKKDDRDRLSGTPGGEEEEGSGVYPASLGADNFPEDAEVRGQAGWGQGEGGAEGYEEAGKSELNFTLQEAEAYQRQKAEKGKDRK